MYAFPEDVKELGRIILNFMGYLGTFFNFIYFRIFNGSLFYLLSLKE